MRWDRYEVLELLGRGGMGSVYRARDRRLSRMVALKFIREGDQGLRQRFEQEARAQARLDHPNICSVYEVGEVRGHLYIAMQLIDGLRLDQVAGAMSLTEKVQVIRDAAKALHVAHEAGIIHRDIKPSNIMVEPVGERGEAGYRAVVMDFGLARESGAGQGVTQTGEVLGTPAYMSPEQARGDVHGMDRRTDVYSLGATLYDLVIGAPPFVDEAVYKLLLKVINEEPVPARRRNPALPEALDTIIGKCLSKEAKQRYATALELAEDLERHLSAQQILGRRPSLSYQVGYLARRNKALVALGGMLAISLLGLLGYGIRTRIEEGRRERAAREQAALAQRLGQEMKDIEWLLRSGRQLPLHDLGREKAIVRRRMMQLQAELAGYGERGRGLAHYALGRGHMALHEHQQALVHLQRALGAGNQSAEVHYALGQVLGKHYEQALYEARLSGGGAWAKKRLKEIAPRYLTPAIESLQRSRTMRLDAAAYLEGLIAFYQHEHEVALRHADAALREAPWLYEGAQLAGDVHHERALQARDGGRYEEAEREFAAAVKRYEQAGEIGRSDAQVHERLAECWVRRIEMAMNRGQPTEAAYERGLAAAARIMAAEPESVAGPLKQAQAASMTMLLGGTAVAKAERVQACLGAARAALLRQPGHPYASDIAAVCFSYAAYEARGRGQDPEGLLRQGITILTPVLQQHADFLWGLNDLGIQYITLGSSQWIRRDPAASASLEAAIAWFAKASRLDPGYLYAVSNTVLSYAIMAGIPTSAERTAEVLARLEGAFARCTGINDRHSECYNNYAIGCTHAALRAHLGGQDPRPRLALALENFVVRRRLAGGAQDTEQYEALARLIDAKDRVRRGQDPGPALREMDAALRRCLDLVQTDAMCRTLSAQGELARADWLAQARQPVLPALQRALAKATGAVQSPEIYPDAWQALADAHLRLARARPARALGHIAAGLAATEKIFAVSPGQARGLATKGELYLLQARAGLPAEAGGRAARALEQALRADPLLVHEYAPRLAQAQALAAAP